ncbi:MAG: EamA family transporter [Planctomycetota bacterium]
MMIEPTHLLGLAMVVAAAVLETAAQVALKIGARLGGEGPNLLRTPTGRWCAVIGVFFFVVEGVVWTIALRWLDLSIAQPAGSLTFVCVALASRVFLKERISARRWAGIALILVGVAAIGAS